MTQRMILCFAAAAMLLLGLASAASAQSAGPLIDTPVYYPAAKRYFLMIDNNAQGSHWAAQYANTTKIAEARVFHGVHGRLAIVDSLAVYQFLKNTFRPNDFAWIGLRYMCNRRQLVWSDGSLFKPGSFQAWDKKWDQDVFFCEGKPPARSDAVFGPVAYNPATGTWVAKGSGKGYRYSFVEFPTGSP